MKVTTAERLKQIMKEENLKQVDILERSKKYCEIHKKKLTKTDLSQYVSGKVVPGQDKLFILALTLNVNEAWLMGYNVSKERKVNKDLPEQIGEKDKIMTVLSKRKDLLAFVNLIVDNEEDIDESDIEKTTTMVETFFLDKDKKKKD